MQEKTYELLKHFVRSKCPEAKCVQCVKDGQVGYAILGWPSAARTVAPIMRTKQLAWRAAAESLGMNVGGKPMPPAKGKLVW